MEHIYYVLVIPFIAFLCFWITVFYEQVHSQATCGWILKFYYVAA